MEAVVRRSVFGACGILAAVVTRGVESGEPSFPVMQAVPMAGHVVSFQRDGEEVAGYHHGPELRRPFLFPVVGPGGRPLTRLGHPHDPVGHSHHNSVWVSHKDVNGVSFWEDGAPGRIVQRSIERLDDGAVSAGMLAANAWLDGAGEVLLNERRLVSVRGLPAGETLITIDMEFSAGGAAATFGRTPFGAIGVRMTKTVGVKDGGGQIRNSEGGINEAGTFQKAARWVDYSGRVTATAVEGIALMDHPGNPGHPSAFHTRDDGWMGACLSKDEPVTVEAGRPLRLRYALYLHAKAAPVDAIEARWREFAADEMTPLAKAK